MNQQDIKNHVKTLKKVQKLANAGKYDDAIKLTNSLPKAIGIKAHLLVIELEQINLKAKQP